MERSNGSLVVEFAEVLRQTRLRAGMTQEDLADRAGVSVRFVSLLETGRRQPSLSALAALGHGLGMPMSELIRLLEDRLAATDGQPTQSA